MFNLRYNTLEYELLKLFKSKFDKNENILSYMLNTLLSDKN
jgi:hypothetical protein